MSKVYVQFPKTGLGNMLLVWAKASVFAHINNLDLITSSWWGFRWGALLRGENKKRIYKNYFTETEIGKRLLAKIKLINSSVEFDPAIEIVNDVHEKPGKTYVFKKVINDIDLFGSIRDHRIWIKEKIFSILHPERKKELEASIVPVIAVHIRRGDFKIANQQTPLNYFINAIKIIRESSMANLPVTIFSDADKKELADILALPAVNLEENKSDIVDILLMSKSRVLIISQSSTFSYWAAFLSDALVVIPFNDWQNKLRPVSENYDEIKWDENDVMSSAIFKQAVKSLQLQ